MSDAMWDNSSPGGEFFIEGAGKTFSLDENRNGGGLRSDIPTKVVSKVRKPFENFYAAPFSKSKIDFELYAQPKLFPILTLTLSETNSNSYSNIKSHLNCLYRNV